MSPRAGATDLTAIVVTYRSRELVAGAIHSIRAASKATSRSVEIIVIDNASPDGSADAVEAEHPDVRLIRNDKNVGFGRANNQAFAVARGTWWLLLNPDARLEGDALSPLLTALAQRPDLAAAGPAISGGGTGAAESAGELPGLRSLAAHFLFLNRLPLARRGGPWAGFQVRAGAGAEAREVGWLSGAAVVLRPEAIRTVGGFDPAIFLYGEDVELGYRLGAAGWRLALIPMAQASHAIGGSQSPRSTRWIDGIEAYLERRGRSRTAIAGSLAIIGAGLAVRWIAAILARKDGAHRARMRSGARHAAARSLRRAAGR
jgi:GT2 family glycosyltransferase